MSALTRWLPSVPLLGWSHQYNRVTLITDFTVALVVGIILIQQSLA